MFVLGHMYGEFLPGKFKLLVCQWGSLWCKYCISQYHYTELGDTALAFKMCYRNAVIIVFQWRKEDFGLHKKHLNSSLCKAEIFLYKYLVGPDMTNPTTQIQQNKKTSKE